ncbi:hypothetical protein GCM10027059_12540 [Myceligenerans halotolerans]
MRKLASAPAPSGGRFTTSAGAARQASPFSLAPYDPEHEAPDDAILRAADTLGSLLDGDARDELITRLLAARIADDQRQGLAPAVAAHAHIPDDYGFDTALPAWPDELLFPETNGVEHGVDGVELYVSVDRRRAAVRQNSAGAVDVTWTEDDDAGPEFTPEQLDAANAYLRAMYDRADQLTTEIDHAAFDSVRETIAAMLDHE